jgi:A/G-specific adenine glycosylase
MATRPGPAEARTIRRKLLRWYDRHRRELPWRRRSDPYAVWVAEVLLQQTRVETVKPYFVRFLRRFPDVEALAAADVDDVLKAWEGLGYYGRARNLHRAARQVARDHGGDLPATATELRRLPGVGAYTAAAIASIAFGADEPVLDGNVARVLCRLFRVGGDPRTSGGRKRLTGLARRLLPPGAAGEFNQAMMDLGATVCRPAKPLCGSCPLEAHCRARHRGEQCAYPRKRPRRALPHHTVVAGLVRKRGRLLIDRRPDEGLLGGLWELPGGKVRRGESHRAALRREVREELGIEVEPEGKLTTVRHAYSHFRITLHAYHCRHVRGRARPIACTDCKWIWPSRIERYAFPAANRKVFAALRAERAKEC